MAQVNVKSKIASTFLGLESTFGTTASSLYRAFPVAGTVELAHSQTEIENETESARLYDRKNTVRGLKGGTVKFDMYPRVPLVAYSGSNYPSENYQQQALKAVFGGHQTSTGSLAGGAPSTTVIPVDTIGYFSRGQWALFTTTAGLEPALVISSSATALTVTPALSSAPASGSVVANMDNFYPTETNTNTLTFQHAKVDSSDMQWTYKGCKVNSFDLKIERDKEIVASFELEAKTWTTGSQSIAVTYATESLGSPFAAVGVSCSFQSTATTTRVHYPLESVTFKVTPGMMFLEELGGVEGATGVMRTGERTFAEATLKFRADTQADFNWNAQTDMQLHVMVPKLDSNGVRRWMVASIPTCQIVGAPKWTDADGRLICEVTVKSKLNGLVAGQSSDLSYAPFVLAHG